MAVRSRIYGIFAIYFTLNLNATTSLNMTTEIKHPTKEQQHKDYIEGLKIYYDFFKHLTTLSTASLLLLATLLEKFFKAPSWTVLIGITFFCFFVSLVSSVLSMAAVGLAIADSGMVEDSRLKFLSLGGVCAVGGILCAFVFLVLFSLRNFYS